MAYFFVQVLVQDQEKGMDEQEAAIHDQEA